MQSIRIIHVTVPLHPLGNFFPCVECVQCYGTKYKCIMYTSVEVVVFYPSVSSIRRRCRGRGVSNAMVLEQK